MGEFGTMAILAGGKSSRFGRDKSEIEINGYKLIDSIIERISGEFNEVFIIGKNDDLHLKNKVRYVPDSPAGMGPLGGLYTALNASPDRYVYLLACDMPHVNVEYVKFLKRRILAVPCNACITRTSLGIEPFNAFYSKSLIGELENYLDAGGKSFKEFLKDQDCLYINEEEARIYSPGLTMFYNINTRKAFDNYVKLAGIKLNSNHGGK